MLLLLLLCLVHLCLDSDQPHEIKWFSTLFSNCFRFWVFRLDLFSLYYFKACRVSLVYPGRLFVAVSLEGRHRTQLIPHSTIYMDVNCIKKSELKTSLEFKYLGNDSVKNVKNFSGKHTHMKGGFLDDLCFNKEWSWRKWPWTPRCQQVSKSAIQGPMGQTQRYYRNQKVAF